MVQTTLSVQGTKDTAVRVTVGRTYHVLSAQCVRVDGTFQRVLCSRRRRNARVVSCRTSDETITIMIIIIILECVRKSWDLARAHIVTLSKRRWAFVLGGGVGGSRPPVVAAAKARLSSLQYTGRLF